MSLVSTGGIVRLDELLKVTWSDLHHVARIEVNPANLPVEAGLRREEETSPREFVLLRGGRNVGDGAYDVSCVESG